jgi:DinB superfamily
MPEREILSLEPDADDPDVGRWLSAMADSRRDTMKELDGRVTDDMLEVVPDGDLNSIGTILYHVALVEVDWVLVDVLGSKTAPDWPKDLLPYGDRDRDGRLTEVRGETLEDHLRRLEGARAIVLEHFVPMSNEEFHRLRAREEYDVSAAWVLHHLLQHEAEHRAHVAWVRDRLVRD